jgi:hypothetical protein
MLETLFALNMAQRRMKAQFEMDETVARRPRRSPERRPPFHTAPTPMTRGFARLKPSRAESR